MVALERETQVVGVAGAKAQGAGGVAGGLLSLELESGAGRLSLQAIRTRSRGRRGVCFFENPSLPVGQSYSAGDP